MKYHVTFFLESKGLYDCREYRTKKQMQEALDILKARHDVSVLFWYKISEGISSSFYIKGAPEPKQKQKKIDFVVLHYRFVAGFKELCYVRVFYTTGAIRIYKIRPASVFEFLDSARLVDVYSDHELGVIRETWGECCS